MQVSEVEHKLNFSFLMPFFIQTEPTVKLKVFFMLQLWNARTKQRGSENEIDFRMSARSQ